ncbi:hypothetical protein B0T10DRAFT_490609 [Thelonectria olida]|uniref:Uncharacterized protein n=1 Tax=Thelonectria olida TaxID=1576542 RepID=A0A9P8W4F9_9HYPO|nr:hypothetical protein B0T10DRAFT_490609 [Thelonectria olida]
MLPFSNPQLKADAAVSSTSSFDKPKSRLLQWPRAKLHGGISRPFELLINILGILVALGIVVYICILLRFSGRPLKEAEGVGNYLVELSRLGPTVYPLMFAFILGKAIKSYARWRMQRGERIGLLDLLYGSTTATGTVSTIFELQTIGLVAIGLVLIWSLSPLGGQAILRVLLLKNDIHTSSKMVQYVDSNSSFPTDFMLGDYAGANVPVTSLFSASLASVNSNQNSSMDQWGNIKIPILELLPGYSGTEGRDWIAINDRNTTPEYSSLTGIPVGAIPRNQNSTFTMETSYLHFDCHTLRSYNMSAQGPLNTTNNMNSKAFRWGQMASADGSNEVRKRCTDPTFRPQSLQYLGWDGQDYDMTYANCTVTTSHVEVKAECIGWSCSATHMRPSATSPGLRSNLTLLDLCNATLNGLGYFLEPLKLLADSGGRSGSPSLIQGFLVDPVQTFNITAVRTNPPVYTIGKVRFATRFAQLLNTYWLSMIATGALQADHASEYRLLYASALETNVTSDAAVMTIHYNKAWMGVLILSTFVVLLVSIAGLVTDLVIWVPRLMMNVSTLTRGNSNFGLPAGGGALADEERSRLLKGVRVRFGVVSGLDDEYLLIGDCIEEGGRVSGAHKGNAYL